MKCTVTIMLMGLAGSASLLICILCLVLASTTLSSQHFLLSEQACSPSGPRLLQTLLLRPACHSRVLQAGDADLQHKKSSKRHCSSIKQQDIVQFPFLQGLFFTSQFWDVIVRNYSQSWKSLERLILSYFSSMLFGIYIRNFSGYIAETCSMHGACHTLVLYLMLH